jgi:hypothetical protein
VLHRPLVILYSTSNVILFLREERTLRRLSQLNFAWLTGVCLRTTVEAAKMLALEGNAAEIQRAQSGTLVRAADSEQRSFKLKTPRLAPSSKILVANSTLVAFDSKGRTSTTIDVPETSPAIFPAPAKAASSLGPRNEVCIYVLNCVDHAGARSFAGRFLGERVAPEGSARVVAWQDRFLSARVHVVDSLERLLEVQGTAHGIIVLGDASHLDESLRRASIVVEALKNSSAFLVFALNKCDGFTRVSAGSVADLVSSLVKEGAEVNGRLFDAGFAVSALTGLNVDQAFNKIVDSTLTSIKVIEDAAEENPVYFATRRSSKANATRPPSGSCTIC